MKNLLRSIAILPALLLSIDLGAQTINTFAGNHTAGYSGDGSTATDAKCFAPAGAAVDAAGNVYFCELGNSVVRKVSPAGVITTIAGTGVQGFSGNGGPATAAQINQPTSVAVDNAGNIYFTDDANNMVRKITPDGIINTIAGTGTAGFSDNIPATDAELNGPSGVALDKKGNIYIADVYNHSIRKIDTGGHIVTICGDGSPGYSGDGGPANIAELNFPKGVAVDTGGNLFIVDQGNSVIRRINLAGNIITYAGNGTFGYSGDGGLGYNAALNTPTEVAVDRHNALYIADFTNHVVRKVLPSGTISTVAGNGTNGYSGDGGSPLAAQMGGPYGIAINNTGDKMYITDEINNVVRVVNFNAAGINTVSSDNTITIIPNPSDGIFKINLTAAATASRCTVTDMMGRSIYQQDIAPGQQECSISMHAPAGSYILTIEGGEHISRSTLTIY